MSLDPPPATGKIRIVQWQGHHDMQVVGENHDGIECERTLVARDAKATRSAVMLSTRSDDRRSANVTVKKNVPPGTTLRR
jgi:hypothetical protein